MTITDICTKMSMPRIYFLQVQESFFLNIQRQDHYVWNSLCCLMISLQEKTCSPVNCIIICTCIIYMCLWVLNICNNYTYALNIHVYIQVCMCLCTQIVYTYIHKIYIQLCVCVCVCDIFSILGMIMSQRYRLRLSLKIYLYMYCGFLGSIASCVRGGGFSHTLGNSWSPAAAAAKSRQSCPTLCNPTDGCPTGSSVPGTLQARILEWVAISFSNAWKRKVKVKSLSHVWLLATPWTVAYQAPLSMGFSR